MPGSYFCRSWEGSSVPDGAMSGGAGKGNRNPVIHADEKSEIPIVPKKLPNNGCCCPAEAMEEMQLSFEQQLRIVQQQYKVGSNSRKPSPS